MFLRTLFVSDMGMFSLNYGERIAHIVACVQTSPISFASSGKGNPCSAASHRSDRVSTTAFHPSVLEAVLITRRNIWNRNHFFILSTEGIQILPNWRCSWWHVGTALPVEQILHTPALNVTNFFVQFFNLLFPKMCLTAWGRRYIYRKTMALRTT